MYPLYASIVIFVASLGIELVWAVSQDPLGCMHVVSSASTKERRLSDFAQSCGYEVVFSRPELDIELTEPVPESGQALAMILRRMDYAIARNDHAAPVLFIIAKLPNTSDADVELSNARNLQFDHIDTEVSAINGYEEVVDFSSYREIPPSGTRLSGPNGLEEWVRFVRLSKDQLNTTWSIGPDGLEEWISSQRKAQPIDYNRARTFGTTNEGLIEWVYLPTIPQSGQVESTRLWGPDGIEEWVDLD